MTRQEAFDRNWQWFVVEGHPRAVAQVGEGNQCMYWTPEGNKCSIGCLMPDELAQGIQKAGYTMVSRAFNQLSDLFPELLGAPVEFWHQLQFCHDDGRATTSDSMEERLRQFAAQQRLTIPTERAL